jgi:hypothetical protein
MLRPAVAAGCVLACCAGGALAFEVRAVIKKVDADRGLVVFHAGSKDRALPIPRGVKVFDAAGKELAAGLRAKELKPGIAVTLTVERVNDKPVLRAIRLGQQDAPPTASQPTPPVDTSGLQPLTDLGNGVYKGFTGSLYPDGKNVRPVVHERAGLALARQVRPLDADGKPGADGMIVLLGVGFSNTVQAFAGFQQVARGDRDMSPHVVLVNGAVGGMSANMIQDPDAGRGKKYWAAVDERLKAAGVTRAQVQVVWLKETNPAPHVGGFPKYVRALEGELARIVQVVHARFPNVKLVYLSSRTYGGWAKAAPGRAAPGNSEPFSYESGFAVQWLIARQLRGDPALNYDPAKGAVKAPWLSWGPYLWANGARRRADGFYFTPSDFREDDRMHHSPQGMRKLGNELLRFFKTDTTARGWFVRNRKGQE